MGNFLFWSIGAFFVLLFAFEMIAAFVSDIKNIDRKKKIQYILVGVGLAIITAIVDWTQYVYHWFKSS